MTLYCEPTTTIPRISTVTVAVDEAHALYRLRQLRNLLLAGDAPIIARVNLRTWEVTLETPENEQPGAVLQSG